MFQTLIFSKFVEYTSSCVRFWTPQFLEFSNFRLSIPSPWSLPRRWPEGSLFEGYDFIFFQLIYLLQKCLKDKAMGDGQTEAEGVPSQVGRGDALPWRSSPIHDLTCYFLYFFFCETLYGFRYKIDFILFFVPLRAHCTTGNITMNLGG